MLDLAARRIDRMQLTTAFVIMPGPSPLTQSSAPTKQFDVEGPHRVRCVLFGVMARSAQRRRSYSACVPIQNQAMTSPVMMPSARRPRPAQRGWVGWRGHP
jgi:hypothetical protein